jgi:hypothetical protein
MDLVTEEIICSRKSMKAHLQFCEMLSNESLVRWSSGYITKASPGYPNCCWAVVKLL